MKRPRVDAVTVVVFARWPRPGQVKRRLARNLGAARAARIYHATLWRTLRLVEHAGFTRRILQAAHLPEVPCFRASLRRRGWRVEAQVRGDLGQRMAAAITRHSRGTAVLLIGSDLADISAGDLRRAAAVLEVPATAVVGPAADGGFWLLGLQRSVKTMFDGLAWSTATVAAGLSRNLGEAGLDLCELAPRHDIDRASDLVRRGYCGDRGDWLSAGARAPGRAARRSVR